MRGKHLNIIFEDRDVLVVNKPPGLLTSTVPREPRPTLLKMVREYVAAQDPRARVGVVHRLDREARGLLVFSKNHEAYASLKKQFRMHTVQRVYTAVVEGGPQAQRGHIESWLVEHNDGSVHATQVPGKGERAITNYEVVERRGERTLMRLTLLTGRKHQIRTQLSGRKMPVVGDEMYGRGGGPLMLAATRLGFEHPRTGKKMVFEAPPPSWVSPPRPTPRPGAPKLRPTHG